MILQERVPGSKCTVNGTVDKDDILITPSFNKKKSPSLFEERVATKNYPVRTRNSKQFCYCTFSQTFNKCRVNKKLEQINWLKRN